MKKALASYALCLAAVVISACQMFSQPAYRAEIPADQALPPGAVLVETKEDGTRVVDVPAVKGGVDQAKEAAEAAGIAGVPYASVAAVVLGFISSIGTFLSRRDTKNTQKEGEEMGHELVREGSQWNTTNEGLDILMKMPKNRVAKAVVNKMVPEKKK